MIKRFVLLVCLSVFGFNASAQTTPFKKVETLAYKLDVPTSWETRVIGDVGVSFLALAPLTSDTDPFRENLTIVVQDVAGTSNTMKSIMEESKHDIINQLDRGNVFDEGSGTSKQGKYQRMAYSTFQNGIALRYESRFFQVGTKVYILLFSSEKALYPEYERRATQMMDSFVINP